MRLPAEALLGERGRGFAQAMATLDVFRTTVGAAALGFARRALDEATGNQLWTWSAPGDVLAGPVAATDSHVFVCGASTTYAIDIDTHQVIWSYPSAGALTLSEGQLPCASPESAHTWSGRRGAI